MAKMFSTKDKPTQEEQGRSVQRTEGTKREAPSSPEVERKKVNSAPSPDSRKKVPGPEEGGWYVVSGTAAS
eukprot:13686924-Heterocapsa_arctica.AAC.1